MKILMGIMGSISIVVLLLFIQAQVLACRPNTGDPEGTGRRALVEGSGKILMVS